MTYSSNDGTGWRRPIGCHIILGHCPQKSPVISGSFAKRDLQLKVSYASSLPCTYMAYVSVKRDLYITEKWPICQLKETNVSLKRGLSVTEKRPVYHWKDVSLERGLFTRRVIHLPHDSFISIRGMWLIIQKNKTKRLINALPTPALIWNDCVLTAYSRDEYSRHDSFIFVRKTWLIPKCNTSPKTSTSKEKMVHNQLIPATSTAFATRRIHARHDLIIREPRLISKYNVIVHKWLIHQMMVQGGEDP